MMRYLYTLLALALLASCSNTYYYSTLSTNDEGIVRGKFGEFIFETDTVQIAYSFDGKDGPILVSVQNKLDKPMYIDWFESVIVINDVATSYRDGKPLATDEPNVYKAKYEEERKSVKTTSSGFEYNPNYVSFVPPMRKTQHCSLQLANLNFKNINKKDYVSSTMTDADKREVKVKSVDFTEENSPLFFESDLVLFLEDGTSYTITQSFFISKLAQTKKLPPTELSGNLLLRKDLVVTINEANNKGWEVAAMSGVLLGVTVLDAVVDALR